jgi:hypothetical protein
VPLVVYQPPSSSSDLTLSSHESKALKHGHCRGRISSIGADRGNDEIWIYGFADSFVIFNNIAGQIAGQIASSLFILSDNINFAINKFQPAASLRRAQLMRSHLQAALVLGSIQSR